MLSVSIYAQATAIRAEPKPKPEVQVLLDQGDAFAKTFLMDEALKSYAMALKKADELDDNEGRGWAWEDRGIALYKQGKLDEAGDCFGQAKGFYAKANDGKNEMGMLGNMAIILDNTGHPDKAKPIYLQLLQAYRNQKDKVGVTRMLINLAILDDGIDESEEMVKYAREALILSQEIGRHDLEISSLDMIASYQDHVNNPAEAMATYAQIIERSKQYNLKPQEAAAWISQGVINRMQGNLLPALDCIQHGLKLRIETKDQRHEATALSALSVVYALLGQSRLAVEDFKKAAVISHQLGDRPNEANELLNLGVCLDQANRSDEAIPPLLAAITLARETGSKSILAAGNGTLGAIYRKKHEYMAAEHCLNLAVKGLHEIGQTENEASTIDGLANIYTIQGKYPQAMANYRQALEMYKAVGNRRFAANTRGNMAWSLVHQGKLQEAAATYKQCLQEGEDVRSNLGASAEGQSALFGEMQDIYQSYISLLVKRGQINEAFALAQKTKARSLMDMLNGGKVSLQQEMTQPERDEEHQLRIKADQLNAAMVKEGAQNEVGAKKRYSVLRASLETAENQLAAFTQRLFAVHPELRRKRSAGTASLAQIGTAIPADTALLEFVYGTDPLVFVVTTKNHVATVSATPLNLTGDNLLLAYAALRDSVADPKKPYQTSAKKLYSALIKPLEARLRGTSRLVICPDGSLWDIPFATLYHEKFLAERFEITYAYSATAAEAAFKPHHPSSPANSLLVLANPNFGGAQRFGDNPLIPGQRPIEPPSRPIEPPSRPIEPPSRDLGVALLSGIVELPGTQMEADNLTRLFPHATVLTGDKAQESAFVQNAGKYRYLHIASHAFFNDASPMLSSIVLALPNAPGTDGYLTARELFDLKLNADLVVLSACNTARGEKRSGDGIVGLSWALFAAGAPTQVISQWSVDDRATATLMTRFYTQLKNGKSKGAALRSASLSLMRGKTAGNDPKWQHPYYWAPFILLGDWR